MHCAGSQSASDCWVIVISEHDELFLPDTLCLNKEAHFLLSHFSGAVSYSWHCRSKQSTAFVAQRPADTCQLPVHVDDYDMAPAQQPTKSHTGAGRCRAGPSAKHTCMLCLRFWDAKPLPGAGYWPKRHLWSQQPAWTAGVAGRSDRRCALLQQYTLHGCEAEAAGAQGQMFLPAFAVVGPFVGALHRSECLPQQPQQV